MATPVRLNRGTEEEQMIANNEQMRINLENQLIRLRGVFICDPLNNTLNERIQSCEITLKVFYPESKLLTKTIHKKLKSTAEKQMILERETKRKETENEIIKLRMLLITQPNVINLLKNYETCLKVYYPESKLLIKETIAKKSTTELSIKKKKKTISESKLLIKETIHKKSTTELSVKKKKKTISSTIKKLVWNINIGETIGKAKCMCCNSTDITQMSFNCGHIIAEANGGNTIVSNLKPICQNCNSSMGTKNMNEFIISLK